jgi:hypothetical protein
VTVDRATANEASRRPSAPKPHQRDPVQPARSETRRPVTGSLRSADLAESELQNDRIVDLLQGAAQGDNLTSTPKPAVRELRRVIAKIRFDVELEDLTDPRGAASQAIAEVLDPAGERFTANRESNNGNLLFGACCVEQCKHASRKVHCRSLSRGKIEAE